MEIRSQDITQTLGGCEILKGVSIDVQSKKFIGIIGPNGSGKSTFLKCLYRTARPTGGIIYFDGEAVDSLSYKESARKVAVVAQHNYYNFDFTVEQVVLMGRTPHKKLMERNYAEDYALAQKALETVGMEAMKDRNFSTLSGGEQQRVILARALTQDTQCLILDEPTNHLDIKYQLQLMSIVKKLNLTVVSAVHDLNIAAMYCDEIYVMNGGRIIRSGPPESVLTPAFIREVYEIQAEVIKDAKSGFLHVLYQPEF